MTSIKNKSIIIPPLEFNNEQAESPRRRTITSPHSARKETSTENSNEIPEGSLVLTPHTPPSDDNPRNILNDKISQNIERRRSQSLINIIPRS